MGSIPKVHVSSCVWGHRTNRGPFPFTYFRFLAQQSRPVTSAWTQPVSRPGLDQKYRIAEATLTVDWAEGGHRVVVESGVAQAPSRTLFCGGLAYKGVVGSVLNTHGANSGSDAKTAVNFLSSEFGYLRCLITCKRVVGRTFSQSQHLLTGHSLDREPRSRSRFIII